MAEKMRAQRNERSSKIAVKRIKLIILLCLSLICSAVLAGLLFTLHGRQENQEPYAKVRGDGMDAAMVLEKIRLVEDKQGRKTWELEASSIEQHEDQNFYDLKDVKVTVYTKEGRTFVLTGNRARVDQKSKDAELAGNVILMTSDGYRLRTESVSYHHGKKQIETSDAVVIDGDEFFVQGKGLFVDMEARRFKILGRVRCQWRKDIKG